LVKSRLSCGTHMYSANPEGRTKDFACLNGRSASMVPINSTISCDKSLQHGGSFCMYGLGS
jgi:hypothetical protein